MGKYDNLSKEELMRLVYKQEKELKTKKYGLVWDDEKEAEKVVIECENNLPVLERVAGKEIKTNDEEDHILIEGDNYHALNVLNYTHKEKIDIIYIDPPYNTGNNDFKYNDKYVDKEDGYRHSKWLNFMEKRLSLAKNLLKKNGVIFISIDDNEQTNLRLLCDKIFGEKNFVNNLIWQRASGGGNAGDIVTGHEYVLVYLKKQKHKFFGERSTRGKVIDYKSNKIRIDDDVVRKKFGKYEKGIERRCYYEELENYKNKKQIKEIEEKIASGEYVLIQQKNKKHFITQVIKENQRKILYSIIQGILNNEGNNEMSCFNLKFENPKPTKLIKLLINSIDSKNALILDFFAGSGTTGHAVLQLNKEDKGNRKFILCTNNESRICEEVTYPRIEKVIKGYKKYGNGEKVEGLRGGEI